MSRDWPGDMNDLDDLDDIDMFADLEDDDSGNIEEDDDDDIMSSGSFTSSGSLDNNDMFYNSSNKTAQQSSSPVKKDKKIGPKIEDAKVKDFKKTGLMLLLIGLGVLIIAVVGIRVIKSAQNSKSNTSSTQKDSPKTVSSQKSNNTQGQSSANLLPSSNNWVEVDLSKENLGFGDTYIESDFTITGMRDYALVTNTSNDKQLKTVATGNISGLVGTYEIILPTSKAHKLTIGQKFKVHYEITEYNGYKLIGEIKY